MAFEITPEIQAIIDATKNKIVDGREKYEKSQAIKAENIRRERLAVVNSEENLTASIVAKNDALILEYIRLARACWKRGEKSPQLLRQIMAIKNKSSYFDKNYGYLYNMVYNKSASYYNDI